MIAANDLSNRSTPYVCERIRAVRLRRDLTQLSLAVKLRVDPQTVSSWECGRVKAIQPRVLVRVQKWMNEED